MLDDTTSRESEQTSLFVLGGLTKHHAGIAASREPA
jgi:hypothetical protein